MNLHASFSNMKDSTHEDWQPIGQEFVPILRRAFAKPADQTA